MTHQIKKSITIHSVEEEDGSGDITFSAIGKDGATVSATVIQAERGWKVIGYDRERNADFCLPRYYGDDILANTETYPDWSAAIGDAMDAVKDMAGFLPSDRKTYYSPAYLARQDRHRKIARGEIKFDSLGKQIFPVLRRNQTVKTTVQ